MGKIRANQRAIGGIWRPRLASARQCSTRVARRFFVGVCFQGGPGARGMSVTQHAPNHIARKAAPSKKASLFLRLTRIRGCRRGYTCCVSELARPDRACAFDLALQQCCLRLRRQGQAVLRQFLADAPQAEALGAHPDPRLDEALLRQIALRFEPIQNGVDPRLGLGIGRIRLISLRATRASQGKKFAAQLGAAVLAARQAGKRMSLEQPVIHKTGRRLRGWGANRMRLCQPPHPTRRRGPWLAPEPRSLHSRATAESPPLREPCSRFRPKASDCL